LRIYIYIGEITGKKRGPIWLHFLEKGVISGQNSHNSPSPINANKCLRILSSLLITNF
jgi:hypothetical protein